jgi:hypothetical protein
MDSDDENYRLFFYCPTRENQVSWCAKQAKVKNEVKDENLIEKLHGTFYFCS